MSILKVFIFLIFFIRNRKQGLRTIASLIAAFSEEFMGISASMATLATFMEEKEKCKSINFESFKASLGLINFTFFYITM